MSDPNNNHASGAESPAPDHVSPTDAAPVHPPMADAAGQPDMPPGPVADAQGAGEPGVDEGGTEPGISRVAELEAALAEEKERYLRAMAEMENVRRRAAEDVSKAHKFSIESFAESLLPVKDSLEMALKVEAPTVESLNEGVEATLRQLSSAFERNQLIELDPVGQKFDPNHHQAISTMPASAANPPVEPNHVATVLQKGYLINDRVLRPALVVVAEA